MQRKLTLIAGSGCLMPPFKAGVPRCSEIGPLSFKRAGGMHRCTGWGIRLTAGIKGCNSSGGRTYDDAADLREGGCKGNGLSGMGDGCALDDAGGSE
jgi:hypothetical protein